MVGYERVLTSYQTVFSGARGKTGIVWCPNLDSHPEVNRRKTHCGLGFTLTLAVLWRVPSGAPMPRMLVLHGLEQRETQIRLGLSLIGPGAVAGPQGT